MDCRNSAWESGKGCLERMGKYSLRSRGKDFGRVRVLPKEGTTSLPEGGCDIIDNLPVEEDAINSNCANQLSSL